MRSRSLLVFPALVATVALAGSVLGGCSGGGKKHHGAPIAPTAVGATAGDANITVTWASVPGAAFYVLYHAEQEGVSQSNYTTLTNGGREYDVTSPFTIDAANGAETFFVVTAVSADGFESVDSQEVFASPSPWNRAQVVDTSGTDALSPKLVTDGAGDLLAAWSEQRGGRYTIHAARHAAGTFTWQPSVAIDGNNGYSYDVSLANRADGSAIAAWRQGNGTLNDIWANEFSGGSWGTPVQIESNPNSARNVNVAVSPAGGGLAVWTQSDGTADSIYDGAWNGSAWGSPALVENTSSAADYARVAVDGQSNSLVVFVQGPSLWTAKGTLGGVLSAPVLLHGTNGVSSPALAMNPAGDAIAAWLEFNGAVNHVWGAYYTGGVWSAPQPIETNAGAASAPAVAIGGDGDGLVIFPQTFGTVDRLQGVRLVSQQWQAPVRLDSNDTGSVKEISAAAATGGDALAVWTQEVAGAGGSGITKNVYSNRYIVASSSWGPQVLVAPLYGLSGSPSAVITSDGSAAAVWTYYATNSVAIIANTLPQPTPLP